MLEYSPRECFVLVGICLVGQCLHATLASYGVDILALRFDLSLFVVGQRREGWEYGVYLGLLELAEVDLLMEGTVEELGGRVLSGYSISPELVNCQSQCIRDLGLGGLSPFFWFTLG
ncbi:MAG: hypothetical protein GY807_22860 [Gammaproteobacteria bacterium]|nr:hypothetical protein [Gammaproteobacteria bacterium]